MYYSNATRTAVEVVSELIDELDNTKWEQQAADSCREVLRLVADSQSLVGRPNPSIVMLCQNKTLPDWAIAAAVLFKRSNEEAREQGRLLDAIQLSAAEGMMWGAAAFLNIAELQSRQRHPSRFD